MKRKRLHYIDQAKAIGILLIVLGHVSYITCYRTMQEYRIVFQDFHFLHDFRIINVPA